ncbi:YvcK family protein [Candidatus Saccharibacteria bacterium]|nr:YvcK family protein [Candidatus Saccharibacteria bacterium]
MEVAGIKAVVIGGGTGSFMLLKSLKNYVTDITALVNMADDGGSTGILRDELGVLPPGDVRQCLVALSNEPQVRDLFNYRFEEGTFEGHAFGNILMAALEKMTGSFTEGVEVASRILNITGKVEPVLLNNVTLCMKTKSGSVSTGEYEIAHADFASSKPELWLEPDPEVNPEAVAAIEEANMIVIAPGNLYGSLAPALITPEISTAIRTSKARKIFVSNLVTKPGQTDKFKVHDFADEIERFVGGECLDYVLYNNVEPSADLLKTYASQGEFGVEFDHDAFSAAHYEAVGANLIGEIFQTSKKDIIKRTLIRHDSDVVARQIMRIYFA